MHECPACGQACDCDGDDLEGPAPDDCACPCDGCAECPHAGPACDASGRCLLDAEDDDGACPSCGGHGAHFRSCPDLHYEGLAGDDDASAR